MRSVISLNGLEYLTGYATALVALMLPVMTVAGLL